MTPTADNDKPPRPAAPPAAGRAAEWALKYSLVGPVLLFLIAFNVFPLCYNIVLSFTDARLTAAAFEWVGFENYRRLFNVADYPEYAAALRTTALFVVAAVSIELVLGFTVAMALRDQFHGKGAVLTVLLIPMMLSPAVMGMFWNLILDAQFGVANQLLGALHLPQPVWNRDWKLTVVLLIDVWMWTPFMMLIALAALNAIPRHLYEAAEIDRASRWTVFRRITLPLCAPLLLLAVLLRVTDALKQFDLVMAITGPNDSATQTLSALTYLETFSQREVGRGSTYACVILVLVIALATMFTRYLARLQRRQGRASA